MFGCRRYFGATSFHRRNIDPEAHMATSSNRYLPVVPRLSMATRTSRPIALTSAACRRPRTLDGAKTKGVSKMVQRRCTDATGSTQVVRDETGATRSAAARRRAPAQSPARHDQDGDHPHRRCRSLQLGDLLARNASSNCILGRQGDGTAAASKSGLICIDARGPVGSSKIVVSSFRTPIMSTE